MRKRWALALGVGAALTSAAFVIGSRAVEERARIAGATDELRSMGAIVAGDLYVVDLGDSRIDDEQFRRFAAVLNSVDGPKNLILLDTSITDASLEHIGQMNRLQNLNLGWTDVTDKGIAHLDRLENLEVILLSGTQVTEEGARILAQHPKLRSVRMPDGTELGRRELDAIVSARIPDTGR